jgi:hypothetical protein
VKLRSTLEDHGCVSKTGHFCGGFADKKLATQAAVIEYSTSKTPCTLSISEI